MEKIDLSEYSSDQLSSIVKSIESKKTLLISANWGLGKTHFIQNLMKSKFSNQKIRYISLFGIETLDRLSQEIIKPIVNLSDKTVKVFNKEIELSSIDFFSNGGSNLLLNEIRNEIIIFDDIERSSIDFTLILGTINKLKENNAIILICNRNKISNQDFLTQIEKVSDIVIDNLILDFHKVMKKIIPQEILSDVLYSFLLLKEDNLRIAIKLGNIFNSIKEFIQYLSYKEIRLLSCLIIEKNRSGYLSPFYDWIAKDSLTKIKSFLFKKELVVNPAIPEYLKMSSNKIEVKNEEALGEYENFYNFLKKIDNEEFYQIKPCLLNLLKYEFFNEKDFFRQTFLLHPAIKKNNLPNELFASYSDLIGVFSSEDLLLLKNKIKTIIKEFDEYKTEDFLTDFNILYNLISQYFTICDILEIPTELKVNLSYLKSILSNIKDKDLTNTSQLFSVVEGFKEENFKISKLIESEKNNRKYKVIYESLMNDDVVLFFKNDCSNFIFNFLNPELLDIIADKYLKGTKLGKDIISLLSKKYMGDKSDQRDNSITYLQKIFKEKANNDIVIKKKVQSFNKLEISSPYEEKQKVDWFNQRITKEEYELAIKSIKKEEKDSAKYNKLKEIIFKYKQQEYIDNAEDRFNVGPD